MDIMSKEKRSKVMSKIRSKETKCEVALRNALFSKGYRGYRKNIRLLGFEVDVAYTRRKVAVFCDSDFWHGKKKELPKTRPDYWISKLKRNKERDEQANRALQEAGWRVIRLSEHEILDNPAKEAQKVIDALEALK